MTRKLTASVATATLALGGVVGSAGAAAAAEGPVEAGIYVQKVENLPQDFINGVDVSSVLSLEESGVVFRDASGEPADLFEVLADHGVTDVRVRVWNDPYDAEGNGYGGGNVDVERATVIGQRATEAGLRVLVDFHYSDFWTHPGQHISPKAWEGLELEDRAAALHQFTVDSLDAMEAAGVDIRMVQVGNENSNGWIGGTTGFAGEAAMFKAGADGVRDALGDDVLVAVHFTNPEQTSTMTGYADTLDAFGVDYDVFAVSYYPYWHGTLENLTDVLSYVHDTYGKDVMVAETSWAFTEEDGDGHPNVEIDYSGYPVSVQGQATAVRDVIQAVADADGIGVYYWEPAWLPVGPASEVEANAALWEEFGSGWASSASYEYIADSYYGGSAWENQALIGWDGVPLESLNVFAYARTGAVAPLEIADIASPTVTVTDGEALEMPATVTVTYNDTTTADLDVTWSSSALALIAGPGTYRIPGTFDGGEVTATVVIKAVSFLTDGGFESGTFATPWWGPNTTFDTFAVKNSPADARDSHALNVYAAAAKSLEFGYWASGVPAGDYVLQGSAHGASTVTGGISWDVDPWPGASFTFAGWTNWSDISVPVTVGDDGVAAFKVWGTFPAGGWAWFDDFALVAVDGTEYADTTDLAALVAQGTGVNAAYFTAESYATLAAALAEAKVVLASSRPTEGNVSSVSAALQGALDGLELSGEAPASTVTPVTLAGMVGDAFELPATVDVVDFLGRTTQEDVTWAPLLQWISGPGVYTIPGETASGLDAVATVTVTERNHVVNPGFETGDVAPWSFTADQWASTWWVMADEYSVEGTYGANAWSGSAYDFTAEQVITGLEPGTYRVSAGGHGEDVGADSTFSAVLYASSDAGESTAAFAITGWGAWDWPSIDVEVGASGTLTLGVRGQGGAEDYVWFDQFSATAQLADADLAALDAAMDAADAVVRAHHTAGSLEALDTAVTAAQFVLESSKPSQAKVDAVATAITDAIDALELLPADDSAFEALLAHLDTLDPADYTELSVMRVDRALAAVDALGDVTIDRQAELDAAVAALQSAVDALVRIATLSDIATNPFATEIEWLAATGVTNGWANGDGTASFRPLANVNRDVMAAFLYRMAGEPDFEAPAVSPFLDVPTTHVFYKEIAWLADAEISEGWAVTGGAEFRPNVAVNRDVMAAFLYRFAGEPGFEAPAVSPFLDVPTSHVFYDEIAWLADTEISEGWAVTGGAEFRPTAPVKRDVMAAFLYRFSLMEG